MKNCHLHLSAVFYLVIGPEIFAVEVTLVVIYPLPGKKRGEGNRE